MKRYFTIYCTICAYLHDVGKQFIPSSILQKNGKLTNEEYDIIKNTDYATPKDEQSVNKNLMRTIMNSKVCLVLGIIWIILSPLCFWAENTFMGVVWLCVGVAELIIALVQSNIEKKNK